MREKTQLDPKEEKDSRRMVSVSVFLILLALVSVTAATAAWFTIADRTRVRSMSMDITSGTNLRFDLDAHPVFDEYVKTLNFGEIADRIQMEQGYDMREVPLEPVTTVDYSDFTLEDGTVVEHQSGAYLEFTLHFMAADDMIVHLSSADSRSGNDGTRIHSENAGLPKAMRISFHIGDRVLVYDPGMGNTSAEAGNVKTFGLPSADSMVYNSDNALFSLKKLTDQPVLVQIWLEGTDEACDDSLRGAEYSIQLRFVGTDEEGNVLESVAGNE